MVKDVYYGKTLRKSFARHEEILDMPNLLEVQKNSYQWFLDTGLREVFKDVASITDYAGNLELSFIDYSMDEPPSTAWRSARPGTPRTPRPSRCGCACATRRPRRSRSRRSSWATSPDDQGRHLRHQRRRARHRLPDRPLPGIYYSHTEDKAGGITYATTVIPYRGAWLEYETDLNDAFYVRIDKNRKLPITCLIRAVGPKTDPEILELFGEDPRIVATLEKDACKTYEDALLEIYRKLRPGEPHGGLGREPAQRPVLRPPALRPVRRGPLQVQQEAVDLDPPGESDPGRPVADPMTGEIIAEPGEVLTRERAHELDDKGVNEVVLELDGVQIKVFSNHMVDMSKFVDFDPEECGVSEKVRFTVLQELLQNYTGEELKEAVKERIDDLIPKHIIVDDIMASINYLNCLAHGVGSADDIDHLGNRRLRCVGELLQNQFRIGFSRMERVIRERMTIQDLDIVTPRASSTSAPSPPPLRSSSAPPLSQFMDQTNPWPS